MDKESNILTYIYDGKGTNQFVVCCNTSMFELCQLNKR